MLRWIIIIFIINCFVANAQQVQYDPPLRIPLSLSGNFCEVRNDHFHSGIDIKTDGHEGLPVFAVAEGYISRVKIAADGFGKVIYITHPGNRLTVYAHLHSFIGSLADSIVALQFNKKSFEVEWFPDSTIFPIKKGQQIAWSGNSGSSESPHLHFEIRDELKEEPLNPLLNGFSIADSVKPVIGKIAIYTFANGRYFYNRDFHLMKPEQTTSRCDTFIVNHDTIAMSFLVYDEMNDSLPSNLGIFSILLLNGNDTIYHYAFNRMNFNETRNVNCYIDYLHKKNQNETVVRCFTLPGNKFNAFSNAGKGYIILKDGETGPLKLIAADANGNSAEYVFYFKSDTLKEKIHGPEEWNVVYYPNKEISVKWPVAGVLIKDDSFFESTPGVDFKVRYTATKIPIVKIAPAGLPLRKKMTISFKPAKLYGKMLDKLVIVELAEKGKILRSLATINIKKSISASTWFFGNYSFAIDTVPPVFSNLTLRTDSIFNEKWLEVKMKDELSGIKKYSGLINGQWKLFEYDRKNNILAYKVNSGESKFDIQLTATDNKGNRAQFLKSVEILDQNVIK